jgi:hypothetical protein
MQREAYLMPLNILNLAKLAQDRASADIDFGEAGTLHVEYYPQRVTTRMLLDLADSTKDRLAALPPERQVQVLSAVASALNVLLASWDMTETSIAEDGSAVEHPAPLDSAHLEALDLGAAGRILSGVMATMGDVGKPPALEAPVNAPASSAN